MSDVMTGKVQPKGFKASGASVLAMALVTAGFGLASLSVPTVAFAQDASTETDARNAKVDDFRPEPGDTVRDREQPAYDAKGLNWGAATFFPSLTVKQSFTSNLYKEATNTRADLITTIAPGVRADLDLGRHSASLEVGSDILRHWDNSTEDIENVALNSSGRFEFLQSLIFEPNARAEWSHEDRSSPDDPNTDSPTAFQTLEAGFEGQYKPNRISIEPEFTITHLDYEDGSTGGVVTNNDDRDRLEVGGGVKVGYEIVPAYTAFVRFESDARIYDSALDDAGVDRDSLGGRIEVGTDLEISNLLLGELSAGYLVRSYDDGALDTIQGASFGGNLYWYVTPLITIFGGIERSVSETTTAGSSGILKTTGNIGADYEFKRNVLFGLNFSYGHDDYSGVNRVDRLMTVGGTVDWKINPYLEVNGGVDYSDKGSDVGTSEYDDVTTFVGVKFKL
ncbi:MAG: outer membrane beta-barrel protein [Rhodospirillaceae bacterium]